MFPRWTIQNLLLPTSYLLLLFFCRKAAKENPSQSHSLRRADYQLAVPLKLRVSAPLCGFVFQTPCTYAASRKTITPSRVQEQESLPRPWSGAGFTASARKGWAFGNRSPPVFSFPGSLDAAFPRRLRHRLCYEITASLTPVCPFVKPDPRKTAEEQRERLASPFSFLKILP